MYAYIHTYIYVHTYIHIYIHTYVHIHINTYIQNQKSISIHFDNFKTDKEREEERERFYGIMKAIF